MNTNKDEVWAEWLEGALACQAWVDDQRENHNTDWWLTPVWPQEAK